MQNFLVSSPHPIFHKQNQWSSISGQSSKQLQQWKAMDPSLMRRFRHADESSSWNFCPQAALLSRGKGATRMWLKKRTGLHRRAPGVPPMSELARELSVKICYSCRCVPAIDFATSCCASSWRKSRLFSTLSHWSAKKRDLHLAMLNGRAPSPLLYHSVDVTLRSLHLKHMRRRHGEVAHWRQSALARGCA